MSTLTSGLSAGVRGVRAPAAVTALVLLTVLLGGCRAADRVAAPADPSPVTGAPSAGTRTGADPLADVEATVDAVERDVDADADATGR